jgi:hypothetical protein
MVVAPGCGYLLPWAHEGSPDGIDRPLMETLTGVAMVIAALRT